VNDIDTMLTQHLRARAEHAEPLAALDDVVAGRPRTAVTDPAPDQPTRLRMLVAAAAILVLGGAGIVAVTRDSGSPAQISSPDTTTLPPETATTSPAPTTTVPTPGTGLSVSFQDPPPMLELRPFAAVDVPLDSSMRDLPSIAVSEDGGAVVIDITARTAIVIGPDGETRRIELSVEPHHVVAGPGDVLYGLVFTDLPDECCSPPMTEMVAIALAGDLGGEIVARVELGLGASVDGLPLGAFGQGPTGVISRLEDRTQIIGYVDETGSALTQPIIAPGLSAEIPQDTPGGFTVRRTDGTVTWPLVIERHPDLPSPWYTGEPPPAASADGGAVWWTGIGAPTNPGEDDATSTVDVVAVLAPTGESQWWQVPPGWNVAASDLSGTVLARRAGDTIELARLDAVADPTE
jgi:hypothetical protein